MANVDLPNGFTAVMTGSGHAVPMFTYYTSSNVSLNPGDPVKMLSNGTLAICTAASIVFGVSQSKITGATGVRKKVIIVPAMDDIIFEGQCSGTYTPVNAGESVDMEGTTGAFEVNEDSQSNGQIRIIGLAPHMKNANGANARVWFTWTKTQFNGQSS